MIVQRSDFTLDSLKAWDHQVDLAVRDFKRRFGCFPNLLVANEVTFKRIDIRSNKEKVLGEKGEKVGPSQYVRLSGFATDEYNLDFCLDDSLSDLVFTLILDSEEPEKKPKPEKGRSDYADKLLEEMLESLNSGTRVRLSARFKDALIYSFGLHREQYRKGTGIPYFSHLMAVASLVLDYGGEEDEAIAALLHDAIEDQGGDRTRSRIRKLFGKEVAAIVEGCTDTDETPKPPWRERKEKYLAHLKESTDSVRLVSAADKLHNLRTILADYLSVGEALWKRFNGGREGTLWYYGELARYFCEEGPREIGRELEAVLGQLNGIIQREIVL